MGDWQNLSGLNREQEKVEEKEEKVKVEKKEEEKDVMTRWWKLNINAAALEKCGRRKKNKEIMMLNLLQALTLLTCGQGC